MLHATESYLRSTLMQYSLLSHRRVAVSTFCVAFSDSPSYFCDHIVHHNNAQQSATLTFTLSGTTSQDFYTAAVKCCRHLKRGVILLIKIMKLNFPFHIHCLLMHTALLGVDLTASPHPLKGSRLAVHARDPLSEKTRSTRTRPIQAMP